jgi:hypothetical protein
MRSRFARLLASVLVVGSMLVNGMALAQAPSAPARHHGCAEMTGAQHHGDCCADAGQSCPGTSDNCDDQCMFRCQSAAVLPLLVPALLAGKLSGSVLAPLPMNERPPAVIAPALRPPISA